MGLIGELHGWSHNRLKRLTKRPKRHFVEAAFAAADHFETAAVLAGDRRRLGVLLARRYSSNSYSLACAARWRNAEYFG